MLLIMLVSVLFTFTYPLIVDRRLRGLDAVRTSAKAALANFWPLLGLLLLTGVTGISRCAALLCRHVPGVSDYLCSHVHGL